MDWFTDPNRPYIQLFGLNHILYVLIVAVAITLLLVAIGANALFDGNYFYLKHRPVFAGTPSPQYELGTILFAATIFHLGWLVAARFNDVDRATKLERSGAPARDKPDLVRV